MPPKKKTEENQIINNELVSKATPNIKDKTILDALKSRYFELVSKEKLGESLELTQQIDILENEIKNLSKK